MADNLEENPLGNPINNKSDKPFNESIPVIETDVNNIDRGKENMEVEYHKKSKKNWKSYFWEFLMMFLAVICAFLADSYHSYSINKDIEKRNIEMVVGNLKEDVDKLNYNIKENESRVKDIDTLVIYQSMQTDSIFTDRFYELMTKGLSIDMFASNSAAVDQMKSSGSLRLIESQKILEEIYNYEYLNKIMNINFNYDREFQMKAADELFSFIFLRTENTAQDYIAIQKSKDRAINKQDEIHKFFNNMRMRKFILQHRFIPQLKKQLKNAEGLITLLEKEYDLKKE